MTSVCCDAACEGETPYADHEAHECVGTCPEGKEPNDAKDCIENSIRTTSTTDKAETIMGDVLDDSRMFMLP